MQVSNWIVLGAAELFTLLVLLCIFLILKTNKLRGLVKGLQLKLQDLLTDLQQTKRAYAEMQDLLEDDSESEYVTILDNQLENTREYHQSLDPNQDISLDLDSETAMPRQIASLRHAFLVSEKEASLAGENQKPNWLVIQSKLATIMAFFKGGNAKSGIQTLEEDTDDLSDLQAALNNQQQETSQLKNNITEAQKEARKIHKGLTQINVKSSDQQSFQDLLERYQNIIANLNDSDELQQRAALTKEVSTTVEITREGSQSNDELLQLRSLTADQHTMINQLQQRLKNAQSDADKTVLLNDMSEQLDRQKRFVQEAETCIELMENELQDANNSIQELQQKVKKLGAEGGSDRQNKQTEAIKQLQNKVARLEQENEQLVMQLGM